MDYETPQFFRVGQYAAAADRDVIDMVSGDPDWEPPPALLEGLRMYADGDPASFQYPPSVGLEDLREEVAARRGVDIDRLIITNGAGEANHLATHGALEAGTGNSVLLTDPVYPYYAGRANLLGADTRFVSVDETGHLDPAAVRQQIDDDTALVVVNSPNNPLGVTYDPSAVQEIIDIAAAHDALVLSDEVYDHFDYSGRFESALAADSDNVVVSNSFSKSLGITGWRVGYAVFPSEDAPEPWGELVAGARTRHMLTNITGSRPAQAAVLHALRQTGPDYYATVRERLRDRVELFTDALERVGAEYTDPEGAFYVMARFPDTPGTFDAARRLIDEAGVAGMPGEAFGEARAEWFRFALVTSRVETAAARLESYFE
ncbi:MAG: pyridoxal phosphate-dependent aminotransferase [Salinirussus sp.]